MIPSTINRLVFRIRYANLSHLMGKKYVGAAKLSMKKAKQIRKEPCKMEIMADSFTCLTNGETGSSRFGTSGRGEKERRKKCFSRYNLLMNAYIYVDIN